MQLFKYRKTEQAIKNMEIIRIEQNNSNWKGPTTIIWSNLPEHFRAHQKLKHIIKGSVQIPFEHWQAWGFDYLSRKPLPVLNHPLDKEMLPDVQSEPPLGQLWTIPTRPGTGSQGEELSTSLSTFCPQGAIESNEAAPRPPFLQTRQAQSSQLLLTGHDFQDMPLVLNTLYLKILFRFKDCSQSFLAQPFVSVYIMIANVMVFRNEISWND